MSVRRMRSTDQMNNHSRRRKPARDSCSTSPCIWRPLRPRPSATSRYLDGGPHEGEADSFAPALTSVNADDDFGVSEPNHVAVGQLPFLHRGVVHGRAVGGVEVGQQRHLAVPADLEVPSGHPGVGQPELCVLAAADHVRALAELIGPTAAVVELQGDRGLTWCTPVFRLAPVTTAGIPALAVLVLAGLRGTVSAACRGVIPRVVLLAVVRAAVRPTGVALLLIVPIAGPRFGPAVTGLLVAAGGRPRGPAVVAVVAVTRLATAVAAGALPIRLVVTTGAVSGRRALLVRRRRVSALVRVAALIGWIGAARLVAACRPRVVLWTAVAVVVILVGRPPLSLAAAVARIVGHQ